MKDTFNEGIRLGGLTNSLDIKILICVVLLDVREPLTSEQLTNIINDESLANYFDVMNCISELKRDKHLINNEDDVLIVSDIGKYAVDELIKTLPISIKDRALVSAHKFILNNKKLEDNKVNILKSDDGYIVQCKMLDIGSDLLNIELFVGTMSQAKEVEKNFLGNPSKIYSTILEILTNK